jgi:3-deoxy-manno-octulosonate cytidylyltransferase (CMP-KDO synthetase)
MAHPLVIIPARLGATRLPRKPLAKIGNIPLVVRVLSCAQEADVGPVVVATDSLEIRDVVHDAGGRAILTSSTHTSGSDRIYEAVNLYDSEQRYDAVLNLQGDMPNVVPETIRATCALLDVDPSISVGTAGVERMWQEQEAQSPHKVKIIASPQDGLVHGYKRFRALYFTRSAVPLREGCYFIHMGLYIYRRAVLERFSKMIPSYLERLEKLEQLRLLEDNQRIEVVSVLQEPISIDTPEDLEHARLHFLGKEFVE